MSESIERVKDELQVLAARYGLRMRASKPSPPPLLMDEVDLIRSALDRIRADTEVVEGVLEVAATRRETKLSEWTHSRLMSIIVAADELYDAAACGPRMPD